MRDMSSGNVQVHYAIIFSVHNGTISKGPVELGPRLFSCAFCESFDIRKRHIVRRVQIAKWRVSFWLTLEDSWWVSDFPNEGLHPQKQSTQLETAQNIKSIVSYGSQEIRTVRGSIAAVHSRDRRNSQLGVRAACRAKRSSAW
jgi:hypothetical protein